MALLGEAAVVLLMPVVEPAAATGAAAAAASAGVAAATAMERPIAPLVVIEAELGVLRRALASLPPAALAAAGVPHRRRLRRAATADGAPLGGASLLPALAAALAVVHLSPRRRLLLLAPRPAPRVVVLPWLLLVALLLIWLLVLRVLLERLLVVAVALLLLWPLLLCHAVRRLLVLLESLLLRLLEVLAPRLLEVILLRLLKVVLRLLRVRRQPLVRREHHLRELPLLLLLLMVLHGRRMLVQTWVLALRLHRHTSQRVEELLWQHGLRTSHGVRYRLAAVARPLRILRRHRPVTRPARPEGRGEPVRLGGSLVEAARPHPLGVPAIAIGVPDVGLLEKLVHEHLSEAARAPLVAMGSITA
mmetsp:Transcript_43284/g.122355  ORF Transcript_43284/g.122355 Transcript_43284/m.122355 type:complete len:362 (-) Transcript_43284:18-1103(-)